MSTGVDAYVLGLLRGESAVPDDAFYRLDVDTILFVDDANVKQYIISIRPAVIMADDDE